MTGFSFPDKPEGELPLTGAVPSLNPLRSRYGSRVVLTVPGGAVKEVHDIRQTGWGARAYDTFIPLHYGTFGGWPVKLLWCLGGLTPGTLAVSGFVNWRLRRAPEAARDRYGSA